MAAGVAGFAVWYVGPYAHLGLEFVRGGFETRALAVSFIHSLVDSGGMGLRRDYLILPDRVGP